MKSMRLIDANALMDYCNNLVDKTIDANDIARFPTAYGWISVKDRLPDKSGKYLTVTDLNVIDTIYYSAKYKLFNHFDELKPNGQEITNITHWMPLPEPPGGES